MTKRNILKVGLFSTLIFSRSFVSAEPHTPYGKPLAESIEYLYRQSFPSEVKSQPKTDAKRAAYEDAPVELSSRGKLDVVFNSIFSKSAQYAAATQTAPPILNPYVWTDLNLFYGTTTTPDHHLMKRVNRTCTALGEGVLATMLATPTHDVKELHRRQHMIRSMTAAAEAFDKLKEALCTYRNSEESLLSRWTSTDPLYTKEYLKYMEDRFYAKGNHSSNKSAGWLEFKKRFFLDFGRIQLSFLWPLIRPTLIEIFVSSEKLSRNFRSAKEISAMRAQGIQVSTRLDNLTGRKLAWKGAIPYYGGWFQYKVYEDQEDIREQRHKLFSFRDEDYEREFNPFYWTGIMGEVAYTAGVYGGISTYLEYAKVLRNLAQRMADVQAFVRAAQAIDAQVAASPDLERLYAQDIQSVRALLKRAEENSELGWLMRYLDTLPYTSWSYFFNNAGKLLASHTLFTEHKDHFVDAMYEVGKIDAFLSIATLLKESQKYDAQQHYVFTNFADQTSHTSPYVHLVDMWNPFLDAKQAVANSIIMDSARGIRNLVLTGPNAGGKSTFLTGVTTSLLLSQTFGIAPAKELTMTPFNKISTYINVVDDIAAGKSLFMAEVDRAQQHLTLLGALKPREFSFTIFDEPFSGTNPVEGAAAEYSILEAMGDYKNSFNIVATHYPIVMLLEERTKDKGFANYKVYIDYKPGMEKIHYTYKVIPGRSTQAIAIDILEEQGYNTRMLQRAREIIAHPERYQANFKD